MRKAETILKLSDTAYVIAGKKERILMGVPADGRAVYKTAGDAKRALHFFLKKNRAGRKAFLKSHII